MWRRMRPLVCTLRPGPTHAQLICTPSTHACSPERLRHAATSLPRPQAHPSLLRPDPACCPSSFDCSPRVAPIGHGRGDGAGLSGLQRSCPFEGPELLQFSSHHRSWHTWLPSPLHRLFCLSQPPQLQQHPPFTPDHPCPRLQRTLNALHHHETTSRRITPGDGKRSCDTSPVASLKSAEHSCLLWSRPTGSSEARPPSPSPSKARTRASAG